MSAELERVTMLGKWRWLRTVMNTPGASKAAILVAGALAEYWNAEHGIAWPGQARLARELCMGERSVVRAVNWLEEHRFVYVIRRGRSNAYAINWSKAATVNGCHSVPQKVPAMAYEKGATDGVLLESTGLNPSTEKNLRGTRAEGAPHRGASVAGSPTHHRPSAVDNCGRTAEQPEPPEPELQTAPAWHETPEPEPELPSRQIERQFGGRPPVGSKVHAIWRLQRRFEGVCRKAGEPPMALTELAIDEALEDLLERQARGCSSVGADLAMYAMLGFDQMAEFFQPRGQC